MLNKQWKLFVVLLVALSLIGAACGAGDDAETTTTTEATTTTTAAATTTTEATTTTIAPQASLLVWADETRENAVKAAGALFTAETGIDVNYEFVGSGDMREQMSQKAPVGEGPDIFIGAHDWLGEMVSSGLVSPIDIGAKATDFYDLGLDSFTLGGDLYGLPYTIEQLGLFRNTDLVPDEPASYDDLLASCDGLGADVLCLGVPQGDAYANQAFIKGFGGYIFGYDAGFDAEDVGLDVEGAIAGAEWLDSQVKAGVLDAAIGWDEMRDFFNQGKLAYMWDGPWQVPAANDAGINYAVTPFPEIEAGVNPAPFIGVQGFMINAYSENQLLAQTFVVDYLSSTEVMYAIYEAGGRGPAQKAAFEQAKADFPSIAGFTPVEGDPSAAMPNIPEMNAVWGALGDAITLIYQQGYTGDVADAAAAMATAAEQVRTTIAGG